MRRIELDDGCCACSRAWRASNVLNQCTDSVCSRLRRSWRERIPVTLRQSNGSPGQRGFGAPALARDADRGPIAAGQVGEAAVGEREPRRARTRQSCDEAQLVQPCEQLCQPAPADSQQLR